MLLTIDRKLEHQQNLRKHNIGVVVVHVSKNQLPHYRALQAEVLAAIAEVRPGEVIHVGRFPSNA